MVQLVLRHGEPQYSISRRSVFAEQPRRESTETRETLVGVPLARRGPDATRVSTERSRRQDWERRRRGRTETAEQREVVRRERRVQARLRRRRERV